MGSPDLAIIPLSQELDTQPDPRSSGGALVHALVVADLLDRCHLGVVGELVALDVQGRSACGQGRNGTRLRSGNGGVALVDAYQQVLDAMVYLAQERAERQGDGQLSSLELDDCYEQLLAVVCRVRAVLDRRGRRGAVA